MNEHVALVPLDNSPTAETVLPWANALADSMGLKLVLLMVVQERSRHGGESSDSSALDAKYYLDGVIASLPGGNVESMIFEVPTVTGETVANGINAVADQLDAAMVLMTTHGHSGFDRWQLGSVTDGVVRLATRPVFVVRADVKKVDPSIRRVVAPLDGFELAEQALPVAVTLARSVGAVLDLVHVVPGPWAFIAEVSPTLERQTEAAAGAYLERIASQLSDGIVVERHVRVGGVAAELLDYCEQSDSDLIVMSTHARGGLSRWALGSVADRVLRHGSRPVMLVRPDSETIKRHALFTAEWGDDEQHGAKVSRPGGADDPR